METYKGFFDLCVPFEKDSKKLAKTLQEMYSYGYRTVAIEQVYDHTKENQKSCDIFPAPEPLQSFHAEFKDRLKILNRLTIYYSNPVVSHAMNNSKNLKKFHLIAGVPKSDAAMQHCCSTFVGDIIAMNLVDDTRSIIINHKCYQLAIRRGLCFEIKYSPAIVDSSRRREIITVAHGYASQRKSKNVIISSGALNRFQVRGPYDLANLGLIFGLSEEQSKSALSHNCRMVVIKAQARRFGKTVMFGENLTTTSGDSSPEVKNEPDSSEESDDSMDGHPIKKKKIS